jgi:tRNA A37 threonylcarbamoyladenosine dehydratase
VTESFLNRFSGIARLYGQEALEVFFRSHVAVIGIGGVGSWIAEALARSGIGRLTLVDFDDLCITNTNRQLHATNDAIGKSKVSVMAKRLRTINPEMTIHERTEFYTEANSESILSSEVNAVADAIDAMRPKCYLLAQCVQKSIPVVTSGGAGGRIDPSRIEVTDLSRTHGCALLLQVRKNLRSHYQFPSGEGKKVKKFGIPAVFSSEIPRYPTSDGCTSSEKPAELPSGLRCDAGFGTATHLTASFGMMMASVILTQLAEPEEVLSD